MRGAWLVLAMLPAALAAAEEEPLPSDVPRLAILVSHADPALEDRARAVLMALESALATRRLELVDTGLPLVRLRVDADAALAQGLSKARERAAEGRALFDAQNVHGAEKALRDAASLFESNAAGLESPDELVSSLLLLSQIFFATERETLVRDVLRHIIRLSPELVLDRSEYPGALVRAHDELRAQLLTGPLATVEVTSVPWGARVFLDGRDRGLTTAKILNVPPGAHVLVIRRLGYGSEQEVLDVSAFREQKTRTVLRPTRHPELDRVFAAGGAAELDSFGRPIGDWLADAAGAIGANDLILVRLTATDSLELRVWNRFPGAITPVRRVPLVGEIPPALDEIAQTALADGIAAGFLPPLVARRNLSAGGGVLDEAAPTGVRISLLPGLRLDDGAGANFPQSPIGGVRIALDRRFGPDVVVSGETGLDTGVESHARLVDRDGDSLARVGVWYHSMPIEGSIRRHFGIGTLSPFVSAGGGLRLDAMRWTESMPRDRVGPAFGVGAGVFAGAGVTRAVGTTSALHLEARAVARTIGIRHATLRADNQSNRTLPVEGGTWLGLELHVGWLHGL